MVTKRFVFAVGDSNAAGANADTTLLPGYSTLAAPQTDFEIWNLQNQAWETYDAGTNSYTTVSSSNLFGPEIALYDDALARGQFTAGEKLYCFKAAQANGINLLKWDDSLTEIGGTGPGPDYDCFWPQVRDPFYSTATLGIRDQLNTAMTALITGGHTVQFDGLYVIMGTLDALPDWGSRAYEDLLIEFVLQMIEEAQQAGATGAPDVTLIQTHNSYSYGSSAEAGRFQTIRTATENAVDILNGRAETDVVRMVRTMDLNVLGDNVHFDTDGVVTLSRRISGSIWKTSDTTEDFGTEPSNPVDLYLMIGDSHMVGYGELASVPAYLDPVSDAYMWIPNILGTGMWDELDPGESNQPTYVYPAGTGTPINRFGPELTFAEEARQTNRRSPYIVKLAIDGAMAAQDNTTQVPINVFVDPEKNDFNPASKELFASLLNWFDDALDNLITNIVSPGQDRIRFRGCVVSLGTNDSRKVDGGLQASEVEASLKALIARFRHHIAVTIPTTHESILNAGQEDGSSIPFILLQPDGRYADIAGLTENHISTVRAAVRKVAEEDDYVALLDPTNKYSFRSQEPAIPTHYDSAGNLDLGKDLFSALTGSLVEVVQPLFTSDKTQLIQRLRLEGVPADSNAQDLIDESIQLVKTNFYRRLGRSRILYLQGLALNPAPQSEDDYMRLMAASTEIKWVRLELMRIMPMMFVDGNVPNEIWQHEAAFREATIAQIASEMRRMRSEIEESLQVLAGELSPTEFNRMRVSAVDPEEEPQKPGDSVRVRGGVY